MSDKKIKLRNGEYLYDTNKGYLIHNIGFKSYRFSNRWEVEDLDGNPRLMYSRLDEAIRGINQMIKKGILK